MDGEGQGAARGRIRLSPLRTTRHGLQGLGGSMPLPPRFEALADLARGDGTGGVLVRVRSTGLFALWTGVGSIQTLPQGDVGGAVETMRGAADADG